MPIWSATLIGRPTNDGSRNTLAAAQRRSAEKKRLVCPSFASNLSILRRAAAPLRESFFVILPLGSQDGGRSRQTLAAEGVHALILRDAAKRAVRKAVRRALNAIGLYDESH
jgi:hypothetical protein